MIPQQTRFSLKQFRAFVETVRKENLAAKTTLKQWHEVAEVFSKLLDDWAACDLRRVDVMQVSRNYAGLLVSDRINITPWRIHLLRSAMNHAVGDFIAFTANANGYRRDQRFAQAKQVFLTSSSSQHEQAVVVSLAEVESARVAGAA